MPNWHDILNELKEAGSSQDIIRRKYLNLLSEKTGRNTILYYSGWLQKNNVAGLQVNDADKNGLMTVIHKLDRDKGLDLILHTPGGETAATESIVDYLKSMFGNDIRAIIPQLAMSAGTMIACSCKEIVMGKQSSLGPIDPQFGGVPAHGIIEEFQRAYDEIKADNTKMAVWQPILNKYNPTLVGECEKAIEWSEQMVEEWLRANMLNGDENVDDKIKTIIEELGDHAVNKSHSRHLSSEKCKEIGLKIADLEDDGDFQDLVLSVHHSCIHTLSSTNAYKIIENHEGIAFIQSQQNLVVPR
jgi:membrane-bound ClpP family serine protease